MFNNIYAKNFPEGFKEEDARELFEKFGRIESLKFASNEFGPYCFVCYMSEDKEDRDYGPKCAMEAVNQLSRKEEIGGQKLPEGKKFYIKEALKKSEREKERIRETIRFKNSKKRCNLFVKGFPEDITEDEFSDMFKPFGEVENLKLYPTGEERKLYGFVCYVKPDEASTAREKLSGSYMRGRKLMINHYEIREIREMQNE